MSWSIDSLAAQNRALKQKLDKLEKENDGLKKSVYSLSLKHDWLVKQFHSRSSTDPIVDRRSVLDLDLLTPLDISTKDLESPSKPKNVPPSPHTKPISPTSTPPSKHATPPSKPLGVETLSSSSDASTYPTQFSYHCDLKGHKGSVYVVRFSPTGKLLASGSFDNQVKLWDFSRHTPQISTLSDHFMTISDIVWMGKSEEILVSSSYDQQVKVWQLANQPSLLHSYKLEGFVLALGCAKRDSPELFFASTSVKSLFGYDARTATPAHHLVHSAVINSLHVEGDSTHILCGDERGAITLFDMRSPNTPLRSIQNELDNRPISHISVSPKFSTNKRLISVNAYDNVLRVYDKDFHLLHKCTGHHNRNWPIRASFYMGERYTPSNRTLTSGRGAVKDSDDTKQRPIHASGPSIDMATSMLLATGSSDKYAYIYDVGGEEGSARLVQVSNRNFVYTHGFSVLRDMAIVFILWTFILMSLSWLLHLQTFLSKCGLGQRRGLRSRMFIEMRGEIH